MSNGRTFETKSNQAVKNHNPNYNGELQVLPLDEQKIERNMVRLTSDTHMLTKQIAKRLGVKHAELLRIMIINEAERMKILTDVSQIKSR